MKKLFLSAIVALLSVATMSATTIYCKMAQDWWKVDGAAVAVHYWGGAGAGTTWPGARMTSVGNDVWSYDVPTDVTGLMFVRVNGSGDVQDWGAKTKDLTFPTDGNDLFTISNATECWGGEPCLCEGAWSKYEGGTTPDPGTGDQPTKYWYYKGYIDGGDLVNEAGGFNIFKCGTAHLDVETDAYLFVIYQEKGVAGVEYGAASYVDGPTQATLTTTGKEKLHVTAGSYTLYLYKDGANVILSTQPISGKELVSENCSGTTPDPGSAIQHVNATLDLNAPMFDILGRKVNADYKGIVIQNGQKYIR